MSIYHIELRQVVKLALTIQAEDESKELEVKKAIEKAFDKLKADGVDVQSLELVRCVKVD